jgi:hypothetical protein
VTWKRAALLRIASAVTVTAIMLLLTLLAAAFLLRGSDGDEEVTLWTIWPAIVLWVVITPFVERAFHRFLLKKWGSSV